MRLVVATVSMLVGVAMLLPAATAPRVFAQVAPSASVTPSASAEPSGTPIPDAMVELSIGSETEPTRDWTIAVTGGIPSVDVLTVPDPTSDPAVFAVRMSGQSATVELTAALPAGFHLSGGGCSEDDDPMSHDVLVAPQRLVFEVVPGVLYRCAYASARDVPQSGGAEVLVNKTIDADGILETVDDRSSGEGWEFELVLADGTIDQAFPITNSEGSAGWLVSYGPGGTSATLAEVVQEGFELLEASCMKIAESGNEPVGEFDGERITFPIEEGEFATYQCSFVNVSSDIRLAEISVRKHIDADGDLDTEDHEWPSSWEFEAAFEDDVEIVFADPDTDRDEPATWVASFSGDSTHVVVTEVPQDGYRLFDASCIDAEASDGAEIPTTLEGNSLSFDVGGFGPNFPLGAHVYFCSFHNTPVGGAAPTLPPTDAATHYAGIESDPWHLVLVGLAALIASLVVLGLRRGTPRRH